LLFSQFLLIAILMMFLMLSAAPRLNQLLPLLLLTALAVLGTLPFWMSEADVWFAAQFYHPAAADVWWEGQQPLWQFCYQFVPFMVGFIVIGSAAVIVASLRWSQLQRLRQLAIFMLAVTLIGPGLLVNGIFKEHWGRPRPHQISAFGGSEAYQPPLAFNSSGSGKSFPSGHSSVGFLIGALFFWWRRERPQLAWLALFISLILGSLIGMARMAMGDHFLSDVIWSAVIVYGTAWLLNPPQPPFFKGGSKKSSFFKGWSTQSIFFKGGSKKVHFFKGHNKPPLEKGHNKPPFEKGGLGGI
jgi:lipid A 4'-phosphatase